MNHRAALSAALPLAAILSAGCHRSPVQPQETVVVSGTVQSASGAPAPGTKVRLYNSDPLEAMFTFALTALIPVDSTRADASGAYSISVSGERVNSSFGYARPFWLGTEGRGDEPFVGVQLTLMRTQVQVPPLRLWEGSGFIGVTAFDVRFGWDDLRTTAGIVPDDYRVQLQASSGASITLYAGTGTFVSIPRLALQDLAWSWRPLAQASERGSGTRFVRSFGGRGGHFAGLNPPPPTRGRPVTTSPPTPGASALADARDQNVLPPGSRVRRIEIDLGAARSLETLFLFNLRFASPPAGTFTLRPSELVVSLSPAPGAAGIVAARRQSPTPVASSTFVEVPLNPSAIGRWLVIEAPGAEIDAIGEVVAY